MICSIEAVGWVEVPYPTAAYRAGLGAGGGHWRYYESYQSYGKD